MLSKLMIADIRVFENHTGELRMYHDQVFAHHRESLNVFRSLFSRPGNYLFVHRRSEVYLDGPDR